MNYNNKGNITNKSSVNNQDMNKTNNKSSNINNNNNSTTISNNKGGNKNNSTINNSSNNNNNTIKTITNINENKKIVRNINFNTSSKSNLQENAKNISHELKPQLKTQTKEDKDKEKIVPNEKKQKKSMIQGIKILDLKNNSSIKDSENVSRALPKNKIIDISENNSSRKYPFQKSSSKSLEADSEYFKEVANIMYEPNTEPRNQIRYSVKENNDNKNIKFTKGRSGQINEAKIERRFGLQNLYDNKEKVNPNESSAIKGVNNIKSNDNNNNYNTISNTKESTIKNRRYYYSK